MDKKLLEESTPVCSLLPKADEIINPFANQKGIGRRRRRGRRERRRRKREKRRGREEEKEEKEKEGEEKE